MPLILNRLLKKLLKIWYKGRETAFTPEIMRRVRGGYLPAGAGQPLDAAPRKHGPPAQGGYPLD